MSEKKTGFKPEEIQVGRHYWFSYTFEGIEVACVIKVLSLYKNLIEGRILDTQSLVLYFSKFASLSQFADETAQEYEAFEVLVEHLVREVSAEELKELLREVEASTKDFFSTEKPAPHFLH